MSDSQDRLAIVVTPMGAMMGSLVESEDGFFLRKPRAMTVTPTGNGTAQIGFSALLGNPAEVIFTGDLTYWHPPDQNIVRTYLESISAIKIAHTLPRTN